MFGTYQHSNLRIEVDASDVTIRKSLTDPRQLRQWLSPQQIDSNLTEPLQSGQRFVSWLGPIPVQHYVDQIDANRLRLLLSQGIDGFHEWQWGDGWVQSRLEGISLLPLNLGQTLTLLRLRSFLNLAARSKSQN
ncbi:MAG: hypothetical protein NZ772_03615 [Cyanobacteria bacterium]|nr:hypothetical protein [Cyanobacteriota bacterium]MDW8200560.1 hypothetical protein [Cyanobacteriota bacterium SKYGB_h_bin112]